MGQGGSEGPSGHCAHQTQHVLGKEQVASFGHPWAVSTADTGHSKSVPRPSPLGTWTCEDARSPKSQQRTPETQEVLTCRGSRLPQTDLLYKGPGWAQSTAGSSSRKALGRPGQRAGLPGLEHPPPPLAGVGRTDSRNAREICPCLHTNVCACLCTHIHIQRKVGLEGSRLPWGSGPTWQDLQETQMLPRVAASQRACREGRPSSGGHQESAQWELSWLFSLRQKEVGKGKLGRGQPPLPTPRAPDSVPSRARSARWRRGRALPHPYLARTGWRGRSSECLRSWSPHTRTCLGPTPRCSLSARHLRGHSDRGQARVMGMGLDGIRAWADQRLQISGPPLGTSAASGKLSLMSLRPRGWKQALHAGA